VGDRVDCWRSEPSEYPNSGDDDVEPTDPVRCHRCARRRIDGAYAAARKHISEAPAGVAIAATLTIAVCTAGLSITAGNFEMALGAGLLFLTNFVCISLAAWAGFFWMGMRPRVIERSRRRLYISMAIVMLLAFPLVTALLNLSNRQGAEGVIEE